MMGLRELTSDLSILRKVVAQVTKLNVQDYGACPFHENDETFSLHLFLGKSKARYYCFACGAQGDVVQFIRNLKQMGFNDAIAYISRLSEQTVDVGPSVLPSLGPGPIKSDCFSQCENYANLREDLIALYRENGELRNQIGLPGFRPANENPTTRNLEARVANCLQVIDNLKAELEDAKSSKVQYETLLLELRLKGETNV